MKRLICICAAAILLAAAPAIALTGHQLKEDADSPGLYSSGYFDGYILGVSDLTKARLCISERATMGEMLQVVKKFLKDHPEKLHLLASDLGTWNILKYRL
jgi:hypothetical protein